jgi:D-glycero-D-manno-heptose 1,7-bisphosphate phosphatase
MDDRQNRGGAAVFLDRDGVLNVPVLRDGKPYPPASLDGLLIYEEAPACCEMLRAAGFALVLVTNQPDVARGSQSHEMVETINTTVRQTLKLDAAYTCYHDDTDNCDCRKPKPGLIRKAAADLNIDVRASFMVGDRWRDVEAGRQAGCRTVWIDRGYREKAPPHAPDYRAGTLRETVEWIKWITQCAGSRLAEG